ncbi:MAG TPA: ornithine cyclodeaminase family protein [Candidatus Baltobacteraceae bacterium]|nr:ornithine cyclodeaminase family protein [Candidatus Baltobacteraceae bacterium]
MMLGESAVRHLLPMPGCIGAMEKVFYAASRGDIVQPLRVIAWQPDKRGAVAAMPAYAGGDVGAKLITVFPQNRAHGLESHQGLVALFETQTGNLLAIAHAGAVTAIRTAAVSGLATRLLAREDANDLALLGSGVQALEHLRAISCVRSLQRVRIWSRTFANAQEFAARHSTPALPIAACESAEAAVRGADLICTVTAATDPVLRGAWLKPGAHVNAVGSSVPPFRELDTEAVTRSRIFVDMRDCALRESDDLLEPIREGAITESDIAGELSQMVRGACELRTSADETTLFKSVGMAIEDVAAVRLVYERALQSGAAAYVDF